mgnify:CR=1 FL=1|tara:strand:+ start:317 stop:5032 length:4716 start_codon:yes stop_codon:yes gene_type:complete
MANSKRNFISGKMNKSLDERLVPNGQYIDALNVRLGSTEDSEIGSVENSKGNSLLTDITLGVYSGTSYPLSSNAVCIGAFEDGSNETIYWFIHDKDATDTGTGKADLIVSFNTRTTSTTTHVVSFKNADDPANTTLNFNEKYLINNVDKIGDLLFFTDNYNPPRNINVTKDYTYPSSITGDDGFSYNSLLVIVKPPAQAPFIESSNAGDSDSYMEDKFLCFAYRYKYEDNEYSATSQFTNPVFIPKNFSIVNGLNEGMINAMNAAIISFDTGDSLVKGIDILFKESTSNAIKLVEALDKSKLNYGDNLIETYTFSNKKIFTILSSGEILRLYDNVPLLANAQTLMGNRLMYGNYYEGQDVDSNINYYTEISSNRANVFELTTTVTDITYSLVSGMSFNSDAAIVANFSPVKDILQTNSTITFLFDISHNVFGSLAGSPPDTTPKTSLSFIYTLRQNFSTVVDMVESTDFQNRITEIQTAIADACDGTTFSDRLNCSIPLTLGSAGGSDIWTKTNSGVTTPNQGMSLDESLITSIAVSADDVSLIIPAILFEDSPTDDDESWEFFDITDASVTFRTSGTPSSLHSNRGYEVGMVYMDEFNRATTVLTSENNNNFIPCLASVTQNKIKVNIPPSQRAPLWAKRYKFVLKPSDDTYETIYSQEYFIDYASTCYFLLEGENIAKIEEGDELIVKADSDGALETCATAVVLEKKSQEEDFISPVDPDGGDIHVPAGVYMKIDATDFSVVWLEGSIINPGFQKRRVQSGLIATWVLTHFFLPPQESRVVMLYDNFQKSIDSAGVFTNWDIPAGSRITIDFNLYRNKSGITGGCKKRSYKLKREFISTANYLNIIDWWNADNIGGIIDSGTKNVSDIENHYIDATATNAADANEFMALGSEEGTKDYYYQWYKDAITEEILFMIKGTRACGASAAFGGSANIRAEFNIHRNIGTVIFETKPTDALPDVWYEGQDSYPISTDGNGFHLDGGNFANILDQDQSATENGVFYLNFHNCFSFGNGVESYKIEDSITDDGFNLGNRVTSVSEQDNAKTHRYSDITYSGLYNDETNINRLNEFNLGLLNFKPLESSFGDINKIDGRKTDILVLQEDKISYVLAGKNLLSDASGGSVLTSVPEVLGLQVARTEDFGISNNPESFVSYGADKFFTDSKRGALLQLKGSNASSEQLNVISEYGMRSWFRDLFTDSFKTQKLGGYDPYMNEYVLTSNDTALPSEDVCSPCGTSRTIDFSGDPLDSTQTFCVNLPTTTGVTEINYNVPAGSLIGISINYQGTITSHTNLSGNGTFGFGKTTTTPNTASITITNTLGSSASTITPQCPTGVPITLKTIVLTNNSDVGKFLHIGHNFVDVNSDNSSPDTQIEFIENTTGAAVFASVFTEQTGFKGDTVFPNDGSYVDLRTSKWLPLDDYDIDVQDNFKYLISNSDYGNNVSDINAMLAASTSLTKSGSNPTFTSSPFLYSTANDFLYLIYDFRTSTPETLCVQVGGETIPNLDEVCCECVCSATNTEYTITNPSVTTITVTTSLGSTIVLGGASVVFCSSSYPTYTPVPKGVVISVTGCDC